MDELEQRLRSALTELAEEVPPSHGAWDEQQRRLAVKSRRNRLRPALMATVAAAVVALVAVPVVIISSVVDRGTDVGAPPPASTTETAPPSRGPATAHIPPKVQYQLGDGESLLLPPGLIGDVPTAGGYDSMYAFAVQRADKQRELCVASVPRDDKVIDFRRSTQRLISCAVLYPPKPNKYVWLRYDVPRIPQYGYGTYLYVVSPPVDNVIVFRSDGQYTIGRIATANADLRLVRVDIGTADPPLKYTARNVDNKNLESGP